ncbi:ABC transporter substrate-binding protein [Candidatus Woesearchaeota archaeon]|nr:ABC transporter substrate-binding protein [Candidatus Woesearchaeota archaeon]
MKINNIYAIKSTVIVLILIVIFLSSLSCSKASTIMTNNNDIAKENNEERITIGVIQSLTGSGNQQGNNAKHGIELAVEHINQQDGINGRKLQMIYDDEKCDAKIGLSIAQKFIEVDNVSVIIGPGCSGTSMAVAPLAEQKK